MDFYDLLQVFVLFFIYTFQQFTTILTIKVYSEWSILDSENQTKHWWMKRLIIFMYAFIAYPSNAKISDSMKAFFTTLWEYRESIRQMIYGSCIFRFSVSIYLFCSLPIKDLYFWDLFLNREESSLDRDSSYVSPFLIVIVPRKTN